MLSTNCLVGVHPCANGYYPELIVIQQSHATIPRHPTDTTSCGNVRTSESMTV